MDGLTIDGTALSVCGVLIALDIATGLAKAWIAHDIQSTALREGLAHKATYVVLILLGVVCEYAQLHISLGVELPTALAITVYIIVSEIVSVAENLVAINPELGKWPILKQLSAAHKE